MKYKNILTETKWHIYTYDQKYGHDFERWRCIAVKVVFVVCLFEIGSCKPYSLHADVEKAAWFCRHLAYKVQKVAQDIFWQFTGGLTKLFK